MIYEWKCAAVELPKELDECSSDDVLVLLSDDTMDVAYYDFTANSWFDRYGMEMPEPVTHWDWLPALPGQVEGEGDRLVLDEKTGYLGTMYVARRACGKVAAAAWAGGGGRTAKDIAEWKSRGMTVERIVRYRGDSPPEWVCSDCTKCNGADHAPFIEGPFGKMPADR